MRLSSIYNIFLLVLGLAIRFASSSEVVWSQENIYKSEQTIYEVARDFTEAVQNVAQHRELFQNWYGIFLNKDEVKIIFIKKFYKSHHFKES